MPAVALSLATERRFWYPLASHLRSGRLSKSGITTELQHEAGHPPRAAKAAISQENRPPNAAHVEAAGRLFHSSCEDGQVSSAQTSSMMLPMCPLTVPSGWNVTSIGPALTEICGTPSVAA